MIYRNTPGCLTLALLFISATTNAQIEKSAVEPSASVGRYTDYSDQLLVKVMSVVKSNDLIITRNEKS